MGPKKVKLYTLNWRRLWIQLTCRLADTLFKLNSTQIRAFCSYFEEGKLWKVSKYQNEDANRRIIRLEQCDYSYLQRAIASHVAFAILYGRHSKHYIKKPEALLGRATDDAVVDIDLGRDSRGIKIARKQVILLLTTLTYSPYQ
ncbi:hypothetical protein EV2_004763 [Malus domestica]